jgi:hypothetical protein
MGFLDTLSQVAQESPISRRLTWSRTDVARAVLGHSSPVVTEVYAELDMSKAAEAMERVG